MSDILPMAWFYRLKAAQRDLIARCGGIERASDIASVSKSQMGRFNNPGDSELMGPTVQLMLEVECGLPIFTAAMAELQGRRLTEPEVAAAANATLMSAHAEVMVRAGELAAAGAITFADGKVTPAEATGLLRKAADVRNAVAELSNAAAACVAGDGKAGDA